MTKPTKWLCTHRRLRYDQSLLCAQWVAKDPMFLHADSEDSDQTGRMPRLIRVFAGCTSDFVMPRHQKVAGYYVIPSEILSVRPSVRPSVHPSVRPSVCQRPPPFLSPPTVLGQSFWNFTGVLRMVWRYAYCFFRILKLFFYHFFSIFNLDIFRALILQICIWSMYLVSATPPTVFGESFWNFTGVLRMVWRYAYCFSESWNYFLSLFSHF